MHIFDFFRDIFSVFGAFSRFFGVKFGFENLVCVKEMTNMRYGFMIYRNGRTDQKSKKGPSWTKKCYLDQSSSKKEPKHLTHLKYFWESERCASASDK